LNGPMLNCTYYTAFFVQINPNPSPKFIIYLTPVTCVNDYKNEWPQATHPMAHLTFSCSGGFG